MARTIVINITNSLDAALKSEKRRSGAPVSEIVRRACAQYLKPTGFETELRLAEEAGEIPHD
jgi:hypothetical protein